jgi:hypothetical protein
MVCFMPGVEWKFRAAAAGRFGLVRRDKRADLSELS